MLPKKYVLITLGFFSFISVSSASSSQCPNINGTFTQGPTAYSSCVNGYEISTDTNAHVYTVVPINCGQKGYVTNYKVNTTSSSNGGVIPGGKESYYCKNNEFRVEQSAFGFSTIKGFSIQNGNLAVTNYKSSMGVDVPGKTLLYKRN